MEIERRWQNCDVSCVVRSLLSVCSGKAGRKRPPQLGCDFLYEVVLELQHGISSMLAPVGVQNEARGVSDAQPALEELTVGRGGCGERAETEIRAGRNPARCGQDWRSPKAHP